MTLKVGEVVMTAVRKHLGSSILSPSPAYRVLCNSRGQRYDTWRSHLAIEREKRGISNVFSTVKTKLVNMSDNLG